MISRVGVMVKVTVSKNVIFMTYSVFDMWLKGQRVTWIKVCVRHRSKGKVTTSKNDLEVKGHKFQGERPCK